MPAITETPLYLAAKALYEQNVQRYRERTGQDPAPADAALTKEQLAPLIAKAITDDKTPNVLDGFERVVIAKVMGDIPVTKAFIKEWQGIREQGLFAGNLDNQLPGQFDAKTADAVERQAGFTSPMEALMGSATLRQREQVAAALGVDLDLVTRWASRLDLIRVHGIGGKYAEALEAVGLNTVQELGKHNATEIQRLLTTYRDQQLATPLTKIDGVGDERAVALKAVGVDSIAALASQDAGQLRAALVEYSHGDGAVIQRVPSERDIAGWIQEAQGYHMFQRVPSKRQIGEWIDKAQNMDILLSFYERFNWNAYQGLPDGDKAFLLQGYSISYRNPDGQPEQITPQRQVNELRYENLSGAIKDAIDKQLELSVGNPEYIARYEEERFFDEGTAKLDKLEEVFLKKDDDSFELAGYVASFKGDKTYDGNVSEVPHSGTFRAQAQVIFDASGKHLSSDWWEA